MRSILWNFNESFIGKKFLTKFMPIGGGYLLAISLFYFGLHNLTTSNVYYD